MTTVLGLFSNIGEHIPIFKREKLLEPNTEGYISRAHYRGTTILIITMMVMVTCPEWISGKESYIDCMHGGSIPDEVINSYCWIKGTFIVPLHYKDFNTEVGWDVSQTGVGPYNPGTTEIEVKAYYQWVPFVLFLQGMMFYLPHIIFKTVEEGKVKKLLGGLARFNLNRENREEGIKTLAGYLVETLGVHDGWSVRIFLAHCLYLVNVVGQIFFTDCFLGYEFSTYGVSAASFVEMEEEGRTDPMSRVFPRVTKCTFHKYGPSGNIQRHDAQCVLPINILNEKIYVFLWFWFVILTILTILDVLHHFGLLWFTGVREFLFRRKLRRTPKHKVQKLDIDINLVSRSLSHGDWCLCYNLIKNMDSVTYAEWMANMTTLLRDEEEKKRPRVQGGERYPLLSQMGTLIT